MDVPSATDRLHETASAARTELDSSSIERWELFAKASQTREVDIAPGRQPEVIRVDETGVAVRSWRDGKAGFAAASGLGPVASRRAVEGALELERPCAIGPLPPAEILGLSKVASPRAQPPTGWAAHIGNELDRALREVGGGRLRLRKTVVQEGSFGWVLATSDGWVASHRDGTTSILVDAAVEGDRTGTWREWMHVADHGEFNPDHAAVQLTDRAILTSSKIVTDAGLKDLILHPEVSAQLLAAISDLFLVRPDDHDSLPPLLDSNGRLAAPALTLADDRTDPSAPLTGPCDGEGLPSRRTLLLEQGVPRHRLACFQDALQFGEPPRGGALRISYRDYPATGIANLEVDISQGLGAGELLKAARHALYLLRPMAPVMCETAGDRYRIIASGVWLDGPRVRGWHPVVELRGQLGRLLRRIEAVGTDVRWYQTGRGFVGAPSLLIRRQPVVG